MDLGLDSRKPRPPARGRTPAARRKEEILFHPQKPSASRRVTASGSAKPKLSKTRFSTIS